MNPNHDKEGKFASGQGSNSLRLVGGGVISPPLSMDQKFHLMEYAHKDYKTINSALRSSSLTAEVSRSVTQIDQAIKESPVVTTVLYRGASVASLGVSSLDDVSIGHSFSDKSFVSTSTSKSQAKEFALKNSRPGDANPGVLIVIQPSPNMRGLDMSRVGKRFKSEKEVLLGRDTKFVVTKISRGRDHDTVYVTAQ